MVVHFGFPPRRVVVEIGFHKLGRIPGYVQFAGSHLELYASQLRFIQLQNFGFMDGFADVNSLRTAGQNNNYDGQNQAMCHGQPPVSPIRPPRLESSQEFYRKAVAYWLSVRRTAPALDVEQRWFRRGPSGDRSIQLPGRL